MKGRWVLARVTGPIGGPAVDGAVEVSASSCGWYPWAARTMIVPESENDAYFALVDAAQECPCRLAHWPTAEAGEGDCSGLHRRRVDLEISRP